MTTYEILSLLFLGGTFLVALLCKDLHNSAKNIGQHREKLEGLGHPETPVVQWFPGGAGHACSSFRILPSWGNSNSISSVLMVGMAVGNWMFL